jgi:hypothetical protein
MRLKARLPSAPFRRGSLPSLYDVHPGAGRATRHARGLQVVPLTAIVGTARHPTQNTADFRPLLQLRGKNWESRWRRISAATRRLEILPPIEVFQVGEAYWVIDGHNRVAAALRNGADSIDAVVTELRLPGEAGHAHGPSTAATSLTGSDELRQAAAGRQSRTAEHRPEADEVRREDIVRALPIDADTWSPEAPESDPLERATGEPG